jgi:hypothetical protein
MLLGGSAVDEVSPALSSLTSATRG